MLVFLTLNLLGGKRELTKQLKIREINDLRKDPLIIEKSNCFIHKLHSGIFFKNKLYGEINDYLELTAPDGSTRYYANDYYYADWMLECSSNSNIMDIE